MGVPIDPPTDPYKDNCLLCWAAGQTPKYIWATVQGIVKGKNWFPGLDLPPIGTFLLEQNPINPCNYGTTVGVWGVGWENAIGGSVFSILHSVDVYSAFLGTGVPCLMGYSNELNENLPAVVYHQGAAALFAVPPAEGISAADLCDLINLDYSSNSLCEFFHGSATKMDLRYAKKDRSDSIIIQFDPTA